MQDSLNGGVLTNWLAIVGVVSLMYWAWRIIAALGHRRSPHAPAQAPDNSETPGPAADRPVSRPALAPAEDIAAISAAVHAMLGEHRIVYLEPARPTPTWAVEGRMMQQSSHTPR